MSAKESNHVKRFSKAFLVLMMGLFVLMTGMNRTLEELSTSPNQCQFTAYDSQGAVLFAYEGDLNACKNAALKPSSPALIHRTLD